MRDARTYAEHSPPAGHRSGPLLHQATTRQIIGAFYDVYDGLGFGYLESVYATALALELSDRGLRVEREAPLDVLYKGRVVGTFRADLLVESCVIAELKATSAISTPDRNQLVNYLRCSRLEIGLLLNFGPRASFLRLIASNEYGERKAVRAAPRKSSA